MLGASLQEFCFRVRHYECNDFMTYQRHKSDSTKSVLFYLIGIMDCLEEWRGDILFDTIYYRMLLSVNMMCIMII